MNYDEAWLMNEVQVEIVVSHIAFLVEWALEKLVSRFVFGIDDTDPIPISNYS